MTHTPAVPPAVTPLPANVPRKAQVGRPARVTKPKPPPEAVATGPKKAPQLKPPVTISKAKNQPTPANVAVTDPEMIQQPQLILNTIWMNWLSSPPILN